MKVIIDVMGGDLPAHEFVSGGVMAHEKFGADIIFSGDEGLIKESLSKLSKSESDYEIIATGEYITMEDNPTVAIRAKRNSSMIKGLKVLAEGGADAMVSAGNTGALFAASTVFVKTIPGIHRAAIATMLPLKKPLLLLDSGANIAVTAEYLEQFAFMGQTYYSCVFGKENPSVGLLNNGAEEHKGTPVMAEAHKVLSESDINFVGNVEGKDVPNGKCDVLVTDGFTGNIVLKYTEGMGAFMMGKLKDIFSSGFTSKIAYLLTKKSLKNLKKEFSASEYGGAPFLGISKPVIKAHGNSDAKAIMNAVDKACKYAEGGAIDIITKKAEKYIN